MVNKYQIELDEFEKNFGLYQDKKIVIYGIGRFTATLIDGLGDKYNFVGLMDKDPANIGRTLFNRQVIDKSAAEKMADLIVINTAETYWKIIYNRIKEIKLPVFYKNGQLAENGNGNTNEPYPYKEIDVAKLKEKLSEYSVVSFDFFDTLFARYVCNPRDVFQLLEKTRNSEGEYIWKHEIKYNELRNTAKGNLQENYTFDELYCEMMRLLPDAGKDLQVLKTEELKLEKRLLYPRNDIIQLLQWCLQRKKEVYIISDMYLPSEFFCDMLEKVNVVLPISHIILSCECRKNKNSGELWQHFQEHYLVGQQAIHIGDNAVADGTRPKKLGIETVVIPSTWDMLNASALKGLPEYICSLYDSAIMGLVNARMFKKLFVQLTQQGKIIIDSMDDMGYCVFGPVVLLFLQWLQQQVEKDGIKKLLFLARDGYLLEKDYEAYLQCIGKEQEHCYVGISRQLAMMACANTEDGLDTYMKMPYTGTLEELFEDRLGISIELDSGHENLVYYIEKYKRVIQDKVNNVRENYLKYLHGKEINSYAAVVDQGFYGNNQRYLNQLLNCELKGYYFFANLSDANPNVARQTMKACFQQENDKTAVNSNIAKKAIFLESLMTAPYGMIKEIDQEGNFICASKKNNQKRFAEKEKINQGIIQFIRDYMQLYRNYDLEIDCSVVDKLYQLCFDDKLEYSEEIKQSFSNDNAMMNRIESMLFF